MVHDQILDDGHVEGKSISVLKVDSFITWTCNKTETRNRVNLQLEQKAILFIQNEFATAN